MKGSRKFDRRTLLRGMVRGSAVAMALPLLHRFMNDNGTALADGQPMPVRFGTWFWGLGANQARWVPKTLGANYEVSPELQPMAAFRDKVSVLSGFNVYLDGRPNFPHRTGHFALRTGTPPTNQNLPAPTLDVLIAEKLGAGTRFRSLEVAATGNPLHSISGRDGGILNPAEASPLALYKRIFGSGFADPNAATFTPDPRVMLQESVLSSVGEDRRRLMKVLGQADRERMDLYFTSVRQVEQQLALQLQKPPPAVACTVPRAPADGPVGMDVELLNRNHRVMADLIAMALACNQTKVFNVVYSEPGATTRKLGLNRTHHEFSHEERDDESTHTQPNYSWFTEQCMKNWGVFLDALDSVPEGDGTLLDNTIVYAHSEVNNARLHTVEGIPAMIAGNGGGKLKTGLHIDGKGAPFTTVGLTLMQTLGVSIGDWGTGTMKTSRVVSELIV